LAKNQLVLRLKKDFKFIVNIEFDSSIEENPPFGFMELMNRTVRDVYDQYVLEARATLEATRKELDGYLGQGLVHSKKIKVLFRVKNRIIQELFEEAERAVPDAVEKAVEAFKKQIDKDTRDELNWNVKISVKTASALMSLTVSIAALATSPFKMFVTTLPALFGCYSSLARLNDIYIEALKSMEQISKDLEREISALAKKVKSTSRSALVATAIADVVVSEIFDIKQTTFRNCEELLDQLKTKLAIARNCLQNMESEITDLQRKQEELKEAINSDLIENRPNMTTENRKDACDKINRYEIDIQQGVKALYVKFKEVKKYEDKLDDLSGGLESLQEASKFEGSEGVEVFMRLLKAAISLNDLAGTALDATSTVFDWLDTISDNLETINEAKESVEKLLA
jgi:hypothetical protein